MQMLIIASLIESGGANRRQQILPRARHFADADQVVLYTPPRDLYHTRWPTRAACHHTCSVGRVRTQGRGASGCTWPRPHSKKCDLRPTMQPAARAGPGHHDPPTTPSDLVSALSLLSSCRRLCRLPSTPTRPQTHPRHTPTQQQTEQ